MPRFHTAQFFFPLDRIGAGYGTVWRYVGRVLSSTVQSISTLLLFSLTLLVTCQRSPCSATNLSRLCIKVTVAHSSSLLTLAPKHAIIIQVQLVTQRAKPIRPADPILMLQFPRVHIKRAQEIWRNGTGA